MTKVINYKLVAVPLNTGNEPSPKRKLSLEEMQREATALGRALEEHVAREERDELFAELYGPKMRLHLNRSRRVQELRQLDTATFRARFEQPQRVYIIQGILAREEGKGRNVTPYAIDQSCKRVASIQKRIKQLNRKLGEE